MLHLYHCVSARSFRCLWMLEELRAHLKQETERWTQLIKAAGISAD